MPFIWSMADGRSVGWTIGNAIVPQHHDKAKGAVGDGVCVCVGRGSRPRWRSRIPLSLRGRPTNQWRSFFQSKIPKTCSVAFLPACTQTVETSVTMPARCQNNHDEHRTKMVVTAIAVSPDSHGWPATLFGGYHWRGREWYICMICVVDLTLLLTRILRRLQVPVVLHVTRIVTPTACRGKQKRRRK